MDAVDGRALSSQRGVALPAAFKLVAILRAAVSTDAVWGEIDAAIAVAEPQVFAWRVNRWGAQPLNRARRGGVLPIDAQDALPGMRGVGLASRDFIHTRELFPYGDLVGPLLCNGLQLRDGLVVASQPVIGGREITQDIQFARPVFLKNEQVLQGIAIFPRHVQFLRERPPALIIVGMDKHVLRKFFEICRVSLGHVWLISSCARLVCVRRLFDARVPAE